MTMGTVTPITTTTALRKLSAAELRAEAETRAGCIRLSYSRRGTGPLAGVYRALEAGIDQTPETPWAVLCEEHHTVVGVETRAKALRIASDTSDFCIDCRAAELGSAAAAPAAPAQPPNVPSAGVRLPAEGDILGAAELLFLGTPYFPVRTQLRGDDRIDLETEYDGESIVVACLRVKGAAITIEALGGQTIHATKVRAILDGFVKVTS